MQATETLIKRLPEELKRHGGQVLERYGLSVSEAVRGLYEYLDREQGLPDFLETSGHDDPWTEKRVLMRSLVGIAKGKEGFDPVTARRERLEDKFQDLL